MFFLAYFVIATMLTEPPKIVRVFKTYDECRVAQDAGNKNSLPATGPNVMDNPQRYFCLKAMPDA